MKQGYEINDKERRFKEFWNKKAKKYPSPFDDNALKNTRKALDILTQRGVDFVGKRILDIGCGTGIFTLPLAKIAQFVVGLDFSEAMLDRLREESERQGIKNIGIMHSTWMDFDPYETNLIKSFDAVVSSMSMAIKEEQDVLKMEDCSRWLCIYIGWGRKRKNPLMEEIFARHGIQFKPPPGAQAIHEILLKKQRQPSIDYIHTSWQWQGTEEEAVGDIAMHMEIQGGAPNLEIIKDIVRQNSHDGKLTHTTQAEQGVIVWQVVQQ